MKIFVTGASGLVGSALCRALDTDGHQIMRCVRSKEKMAQDTVFWDTETGFEQPNALEGIDVVINLAGENIASGRWSEDKKRRIMESRVKGTSSIAEAIAASKNPPKLLINASAIGFYGSRGDELMTEESSPGEGFLAEVCREWERATEPAEQAGVRVVRMRTGVVLSKKDGALSRMLIPFRFGLGGVVGSGDQYMSWIVLEDLVRVVQHLIANEALSGPVNAVAPESVTNYTFTKTLGKVLNRPTVFPLPAFIARFIMGEMADALLLSSTRVSPQKLESSGFRFKYPDLESALNHECK